MEYTPFIYVHSFMLHNYVTFGKVAENFGEQKKHLEGSLSFRVNAWVECCSREFTFQAFKSSDFQKAHWLSGARMYFQTLRLAVPRTGM